MSAISSMARSGRKKNAEVRFAKYGGRSGCVRPRSLSAVRGRQRRLLCDCFGTICRPAGRTDALAADNCSKKIRPRGYTGGYSNLERLLIKWRRAIRAARSPIRASTPAPATTTATDPATAAAMPRAIDPVTGWLISPIVVAALCMKPHGLLTMGQTAKVTASKSASSEFVTMRELAMRFRGILRSKNAKGLVGWLNDAQRSGIYAMQRFARTLRQEICAVRNAVAEPWSNGQTEGQISRLKTLKRAMYGRAGAELLRARMMPRPSFMEHEL